MADKGGIVIDGVKEWKGSMQVFVGMSMKNLGDALAITLTRIETDAKQNTPVKTGQLKATQGHELNRKKLVGEYFATKEYAPFVEFGTVKQRAQPFIQPAVNNNIGFWQGQMKRAISKISSSQLPGK